MSWEDLSVYSVFNTQTMLQNNQVTIDEGSFSIEFQIIKIKKSKL